MQSSVNEVANKAQQVKLMIRNSNHHYSHLQKVLETTAEEINSVKLLTSDFLKVKQQAKECHLWVNKFLPLETVSLINECLTQCLLKADLQVRLDQQIFMQSKID